MTRKIMGLDINGWHDFAAHDQRSDADDASETNADAAWTVIDGGIGSVVVEMPKLQSEKHGHSASIFVGGPQAIHSPVGLGGGWGAVGEPELRISVQSLLKQWLDGDLRDELKLRIRAAVDSLTLQADEVLITLPDVHGVDEARQEFLLQAVRRVGLTPRLLWRPVAATLYALESHSLATPFEGMRIGCLEQTSSGFELQTLTLRRLDEHGNLFAPERRDAGQALDCGCGLQSLHDQASRFLAEANSGLEPRSLAPSSLPTRMLMDEQISEKDEILRSANATWYRIEKPIVTTEAFKFEEMSLPPLEGCDVILLVSPLRDDLASQLARHIEAATSRSVILMHSAVIAKGAVIAGRRIERGIPHYLDHLDQMSLVVLRDNTVVLEDLIPEHAVVPANREYRSAPVTGFGWPAGARTVTFYLRKGGEFRKWQADGVAAPGSTVPVEIQLSQWPAQGQAKVFVTSVEWEALRQRPLYLDWSKLPVDPRSFEEIAAELKPKPVVPQRVCGFTHAALWDGRMGGGRAFQSFVVSIDLDSPEDRSSLVAYLRGQRRIFAGSPASGQSEWRAASLLDYDGSPPVDADPNAVKALDNVLDCLADDMFVHLREKRPLKDNSLLLGLTWSFGRCPLNAKQEMLRAAEALFAGRSHPLLAPNVQSKKALIHGLGRVLKEPDLLARYLDLLLATQLAGNTPAALASILGRPAATPGILTDERVARIAFSTANYLDQLKRTLDFRLGLKYGLNIVAGLLRCREDRPFALLRASSRDAVRLWTILARIRELLSARRAKFNQSDQKLVIIENLLEMLDGSGGKSEILMQIEDLSDTD